MDKIKKGLGRGLSSLIGETKVESKKNQIAVSDLVPNKYQPRKVFDKNKEENPILIKPGDSVQFYEITKNEFYKIKK